MPDLPLNNHSIPRWVRYLQILVIVLVLMYFGRSLFIPISFGLLLALISYPICRWLEKRKWPRSLSIFVVIFIVLILFVALLSLLVYELNIFLGDIPRMTAKLKSYVPGLSKWLDDSLGVDANTQSDWFSKIIVNLQNSLVGFLKNLLQASVSTLFMMVLIPVYASLFLYHRGTFVRFLEMVVGQRNRDRLHWLLQQSILSYFRFVKGTFFVYLIVGALNSIGLLMLGIEHAILYGMITAFMTIIPYIGIIISAAMPFTIALITKDSLWYPVGVVLVFSFVQYLEGNIIFPRVVGYQLNLSTWSTLVAIVAGTIIWGVAGMILFIPFLAILKIVSDQVEDLKPLNILLNRQEGYKGR